MVEDLTVSRAKAHIIITTFLSRSAPDIKTLLISIGSSLVLAERAGYNIAPYGMKREGLGQL